MTGQTAQPTTARTKVAILGGGCGGLAAAWRLTATPALRERFEVTVYEQGWQLGGKGASGRMPHGNGAARSGQRIEEHGLHIWFGFYAHAFRMLKEAYEEADLAHGEDWWRIPFEKCHGVTLYEQRPDDSWVPQAVDFSARGGADRGPPIQPRRVALGRVIARSTRLLATNLRADLGSGSTYRGAGDAEVDVSEIGRATTTLEEIAGELDRSESSIVLGGDEDGRPTTRGAMHLGERMRSGAPRATLEKLLGHLHNQVAELQAEFGKHELSHRARLWAGVLELAGACLAGIVRDEVLWRGFGALDEEDLREWLRRHGARAETVKASPVLRGLYDLTFAYRGGDKRQPSLAAGRGLQSLLLMMNYEGAFMWRMRAGMGDVVFSPLYLALKQRGVAFEFFARVTELRVAAGRPLVEAIDVERAATVRAGSDAYAPLSHIGEWWCWPANADEAQIDHRAAAPETLKLGRDFDEVVLAIPVGGLEEICAELAAANPRFQRMLDGSATVRTKALQVWLSRPIDELRASSDGMLDPPATGYAEPFDTYCDMSHLLAAEAYDEEDRPRGVAYFCAVLPDGASPAEAEEQVRGGAAAYLEQHAKLLWPAAVKDDEFDWSVVFDPLHRAGRDRLAAQYLRTNVSPSDRYVTTPAGSVDSRLHPDESGFENVVLAGDWTHSGIDGGCVEAAVISGQRAGAALIARPRQPRRLARTAARYVEYGALATAPGPLVCERARLYCFFLRSDRARVQQLCDKVLKEPTGGAWRYRVPRLAPVVLTFGVIAGLRSLHQRHAGQASASEPEAAIWIPTIGQRFENGRYVDDHLAVFMPYIWVDDPIAFASGREVYGFAKTQGWMRHVGDPRDAGHGSAAPPDPPGELALDVHGTPSFGSDAVLGRHRLITVTRARSHRGPASDVSESADGDDLVSLLRHCLEDLKPAARVPEPPQRSLIDRQRVSAARSQISVLSELAAQQALWHVFLKQFRDAEDGELAALQQLVEARSTITPGTLRWRRLRGRYDVWVAPMESHPLHDELGLPSEQSIVLAFAAEFGFRMEPGVVRWP